MPPSYSGGVPSHQNPEEGERMSQRLFAVPQIMARQERVPGHLLPTFCMPTTIRVAIPAADQLAMTRDQRRRRR